MLNIHKSTEAFHRQSILEIKELYIQKQLNILSFFSLLKYKLYSSFGAKDWSIMEIKSVACECCGLTEDCTQNYISKVKAKFGGKWLCGLCSEAVSDEFNRDRKMTTVEEAVNAHVTFCSKFRANPAELVADGMRQMLRRRSGELLPAKSKKFGRSNTT